MKKILKSFPFFIMGLVLSVNLFAGTTGKLAGRIVDKATGEPLPFVNVIIMGTTMGAATDLDGYYTILNISPGTYTVKASAISYQSITVENVKVSIDLTTTVDFELSDEAIMTEEIVVRAEKKLITPDQTATTAVVGNDLIQELPVTEIGDVLELQAGIVKSNDGGLHLRGGRAGQISYQIDGVPVTDAYDGGTVVDVNTSAVQELQVISGAFNAEYGQALSGVVNLVTKDGSNKYTGSVSSYIGDYASDRSDIFWGVGDIDPVAIRNFEGSFSGPILRDKLFFFANARYYYNDGYMYGRRYYLPSDIAIPITDGASNGYRITSNGDSSLVAMNYNERIFGQGKLTYRMFTGFNVSYNFIFEDREYKDYNHSNRLTPDNNLQRFNSSYTNILSINHAVSANSFYTLSFSYFYKKYEHYLYENMIEADGSTQYVDNRIRVTPSYNFNVGGTDNSRFERSSATMVGKLDWSTQFTQKTNVQFGGEFKKHTLFYHDISLIPALNEDGLEVTPYSVMIPAYTTGSNSMYTHKPTEGAAYVQAKFEASSLIFNVGVRFDVFDPDGKILSDPSDPNIANPQRPDNQFFDDNNNGIQDEGEATKTIEDRKAYWYKDATVKTQLSPRLGLAFPISDRGVIHLSYGHFFQLPRYELLYTNPDFELGDGSGNQGIIGNADIRPQKTVKGEIGLQQQVGDDIAIDFTVFFEDFRDLTGTRNDEIEVYGRTKTYSMYANSDFGFSRGFIIKFAQRFAQGLAFNMDYTYSITKGNASNPSDARNAIAGGALPETFIRRLNWDQTHTLNLSLAYTDPGNFGVSIIGNLYSGQPYTPSVTQYTLVTSNAYKSNSADKPTVFNLDLRAYKDIQLSDDYKISIFLKVFNVLDSENATGVYGDSGDPYFTFDMVNAVRANTPLYSNTLGEYFTNPTFFAEPRRVEMGMSFNF